ncbi:MAG: hypothetical protein A3D39_00125 [Candidatus Buchananbacteria bacterium RIFCSPHIGHO2_02_FULL_39_17]|uniref:Uncharacterized protein n=1 Tax=Candidatus Buchananbacteria bacterium RIFCSPLOWO2_01_FULL_40_23b TaxID=1797544 RepID=A0A1G1YTV8_9BACT|nr:MAG: hypothetical protein A3D39_00125 [Candidatus Buchananbacteria bacterium RIFCSPHIGHO2_02_FULL_39_17]OGY55791.1 MAG: hypothetical protein A2912_01035 [Candidatus Buchananbacteria bacterium RIFCSPLOWO2_01_FULL_40_23b]
MIVNDKIMTNQTQNVLLHTAQNVEEFYDKYALLLYNQKYVEYRELKSEFSAEDIARYAQEKKRSDELLRKTQQFTQKVTRNEVTEQDYAQQKERDMTMKALSLDGRVEVYLNLEKEITTECQKAGILRGQYIWNYNPCGRKIKISYMDQSRSFLPHMFRNLATILEADGGIIIQNKKDEFDDWVYCGKEICGGTNGEDTYPLLMHAENTSGFSIFFIDFDPLTKHCKDDREILKAIELKNKERNVAVITDYYGAQPYRYL